MASVSSASICQSCEEPTSDTVSSWYEDNDTAVEVFVKHGLVPATRNCPKCGRECIVKRHKFSCHRSYQRPKRKKRLCSYRVSQFTGTFLSNYKVRPWQALSFIHAWLDASWDIKQTTKNIQMCYVTCLRWRSFCWEVTQHWLANQDPIGGTGVECDLDETLIAKRRLSVSRGRTVQYIWLIGGREREGGQRFVVPLLNSNETVLPQGKESLIPIIQEYIKAGSIIYSNCWKTYKALEDEEFRQLSVNHSVNLVEPDNQNIYTQNVERLWLDIKQFIRKPGVCNKYFIQHLGKYLFLKENKDIGLHNFLIQLGKLYPYCLNAQAKKIEQRIIAHQLEESDSEDYELELFDMDNKNCKLDFNKEYKPEFVDVHHFDEKECKVEIVEEDFKSDIFTSPSQ